MNYYRGKNSFRQGNHSAIEDDLAVMLHNRFRDRILLADFLTDVHLNVKETSDGECEDTSPDLWFPSINLPVYIDGPVHLKKRSSHRDALINLALDKLKMPPLRLEYKRNTKAVRLEMVETIIREVNLKSIIKEVNSRKTFSASRI